MKKKLLTLILGLQLTVSFAQTFTIDEMVDKSNCKEFICFNNFITGRGFALFKSLEAADIPYKEYFFHSIENFTTSSNPKVSLVNKCDIRINKARNSIIFVTGVKEHFEKLLAEITVSSFRKGSTIVNSAGGMSTTSYYYIFKELRKEDIVVSTWILEQVSHGDEKYTKYVINLVHYFYE